MVLYKHQQQSSIFHYLKMSLNFFYNLLASLTFTITFNVDLNDTQIYFIFTRGNNTAQLFRKDNALLLVVTTDSGFRHYKTTEITTQFTFTWDGFKINDIEMPIVRSSGNISDLYFDQYTFLSPSLEVNQTLECYQEQPLSVLNSKTNYGLLALIILGIGLLLRSDSIASKFWKVLVKSFIQNAAESIPQEEDPYTTMV